MKSYRFESYIWITAESEAQARERLELIFESSPPEWEVADVEDVPRELGPERPALYKGPGSDPCSTHDGVHSSYACPDWGGAP